MTSKRSPTSSPRIIIRLISSVEENCQALADMPGIGRNREALAPNFR